MANTVDKLLKVAENEIGYLEKKSGSSLYDKTANAGSANYTKYWDTLAKDMQGEPWCQCFVNWCFAQAYGTETAKKLLCVPEWCYYTPTAANYFKAKGQWHTADPKKGDVIYFKNSQRIHHVGIVKEVTASKVITIEGNTSGGSAVIANGGGVCQKSYALTNSNIAGYGRPAYDSESFAPHWVQSGDNWYYRTSETENAHGWKTIKNADGRTRWYYFDDSGKMLTGWQKVNGSWYYLEESGNYEGACYRSDANGVQSVWIVE